MAPPPGYVAYGGYGAVQGNFQKIGGLTKWLVALLGITLVMQALSFVVQFTLRDAASDYLTNAISNSDFTDDLVVYGLIVLLAAVIGIAQLVILIVWTFRMAKNHVVLGRQPQSFSSGATIAVNILGGCTLGILNFFMWKEMWKASDPDVVPGDPSWKQRPVSPLVPLYLAITLASVVAGFALGFSGVGGISVGGSTDDLANNLNDKLGMVALSSALTIAGPVVFLLLVRQIATRHMKATREA